MENEQELFEVISHGIFSGATSMDSEIKKIGEEELIRKTNWPIKEIKEMLEMIDYEIYRWKQRKGKKESV